MSELDICILFNSSKFHAHIPDVSGWSGFTLRAHLKILFNRGIDVVNFFSLPGSLYKSHKRIRLSFEKYFITLVTYFSRKGKFVVSRDIGSAGSCTQPEL